MHRTQRNESTPRERATTEVLYDRYAAQCFGLARRLLPDDPGGAEAATRDAFLAICRSDSLVATGWDVQSRLLRLVRHYCLEARSRTEADGDLADADTVREGAGPWGVDIDVALGRLPGEERESIDLAYFRGHTLDQIADLTGATPAVAAGRMRWGLHRLRGML